MKTKIPFLILFVLFSFCAKSQNWTQIADLTGSARCRAICFSINGKGYVGLGQDGSTYYNDFWEYNPSSDTWTQKASFPGGYRVGAFSFSIGNKGYIGTGHDGTNYKLDFWEYDPALNTWTQKNNFPGVVRSGAVGFSIGNKGYAGTGSNNVSPYTYNDFYEYDPSNDTWTAKANFGGTGRSDAVGFSIGTKGYIGTSGSGTQRDFWEYNPTNNTWLQKADFGGTKRTEAVGFSIGTKGYIGTGYDATPFIPNPRRTDFWEYNPSTNIWSQKTDFAGTGRDWAVGFSIGTKGYIGAGDPSPAAKDFWEYDVCTGITINTNKTDVSCYGSADGSATATMIGGTGPFSYLWSNGQITQTDTGLIASTYTVTVSDINGCTKTSSVNIIQPAEINVNNPQTICYGSNYIFNGHTYSLAGNYYDTLTSVLGCDSIITTQLAVDTLPIISGVITGTTTVCQGQNSVSYTVPTITNASSYIWSLPSGATGSSSINSIIVDYGTNAISGNISVFGHNNCGDGTASSLYVSVVPKPNANAGNDTIICPGSSIILTATGGNSYIWNNGITQGVPFAPSSTTTYTVTVSNGFCTATDNVIVTIATPPSAPAIYQVGNDLNSTALTGNQWYNDAGIIIGATSQVYTPLTTSHYYCMAADTNGCISDTSNIIYVVITGISNTFSNNDNIFIYPSPSKDNITIDFPAYSTKTKTTIELFDINGKLLNSLSIKESKTHLNISDLSSGVYIIKISDNKNVIAKRFLKD